MQVAVTAQDAATVNPQFAENVGLYLDAALRYGHVKADFNSNDLIDADGVRANHKHKSDYTTAMAGAGYGIGVGAKGMVDVYGRYTWTHIESDKVREGDESLKFDSSKSSRLRVGTRFNYASTEQMVTYAGLAYERDFQGKTSASVYEFSMKDHTLKGNTGIIELGVTIAPSLTKLPLSFDVGVQGNFGHRKGLSGGVQAKYEF